MKCTFPRLHCDCFACRTRRGLPGYAKPTLGLMPGAIVYVPPSIPIEQTIPNRLHGAAINAEGEAI